MPILHGHVGKKGRVGGWVLDLGLVFGVLGGDPAVPVREVEAVMIVGVPVVEVVVVYRAGSRGGAPAS